MEDGSEKDDQCFSTALYLLGKDWHDWSLTYYPITSWTPVVMPSSQLTVKLLHISAPQSYKSLQFKKQVKVYHLCVNVREEHANLDFFISSLLIVLGNAGLHVPKPFSL